MTILVILAIASGLSLDHAIRNAPNYPDDYGI